jgi:hypothetical protein
LDGELADTLIAIGMARGEVSRNTESTTALPECLVRNAKLASSRSQIRLCDHLRHFWPLYC